MFPALLLLVLCALGSSSLVACDGGGDREARRPVVGSDGGQRDANIDSAAPFVGPPGPPKRILARKFVVKVRTAPRKSAQRIGYLRGGSVLMAKTGYPIGYEKCRKGWYELETGGFVCSTVDVTPFLGRRLPERRALQPDPSARLPYPYGYSRRAQTPVYRRLPTDEEAALFEGYQIPGQQPPDAGVQDLTVAEQQPAGAPGDGDEAEAGDPVVPTLESLLGESDSVLLRRMERGFYVSLDREMRKGARRYYRTQANGFIPSRGLSPVKGSEFHGTVLAPPGIRTEPADGGVADAGSDGAPRMPIAFVMSSKTLTYKLGPRGNLVGAGQPGYHHMFPIIAETTIKGRVYYVGPDGRHYRADDVRRIDARTPPDEVGPAEPWIDIDLSKQSLVAYEGSRPVYVTLISSGRIKDEADPLKNFETPTGSFRLLSKHLTATMDGDHAIDGPYSIEDVPYVMYFQLAYALHAAFWHDSFGRPRSHGCINLAPEDARHLFNWATPPLPKGWHGAYPVEGGSGDQLGTRLYIRGETPKG